MEKRRPHYDLKAILAQMICVENMNLTMSAQQGIRVAGMTQNEALEVINQLSATNFYKSMTTPPSILVSSVISATFQLLSNA